MINLRLVLSSVGEKISGLFRNRRMQVVELSTSEFLNLYNRSSSPWFCFVLRDHIREGNRWWHVSKINIFESYWTRSNNVVHGAFRDAYPEVFKEWVPERGGTVFSWLNTSNETVKTFIKSDDSLGSKSFRTQLLKMLISEYGDRKLCFKIRSGK